MLLGSMIPFFVRTMPLSDGPSAHTLDYMTGLIIIGQYKAIIRLYKVIIKLYRAIIRLYRVIISL